MKTVYGSLLHRKNIVAITFIGVSAMLLSGCSGSSTTKTTNTTNTGVSAPQVSAEDSIKEVLRSYSSLCGQRKFGDAYQYVASASNVTQKNFVDDLTGRGQLVSGFKDISYNYVQIHGDTADVSYTVTWSLLTNSVSGGAYNYERQYQMVKETGNWKILWKSDDAVNTNSTNQ